MVGPTRRRLLLTVLGSAFDHVLSTCPGIAVGVHTRPTIGAIRWDAWYDPEGIVGRAVEESLGPQEFHDRMPFFGREIDSSHVWIDGYRQTIFDQEIRYARSLGLDYWAYCWYEDGSPLRRAWRLHQRSAHANEMNWCMIWQFSHLGGASQFAKSVPELVNLLSQPNYQKINGAPLIYLSMDSDAALATQWGGNIANLAAALANFYSACRAAHLRVPHLVILNGDPVKSATVLKQLTASAISNYMGWVPNDQPAPFSKLIEFNRRFWDQMAATGVPVVPIVMTGWDPRPRKLRPPPWDHTTPEQRQATRNTYVVPGANEEIDAAIRGAQLYVRQHPHICPSNTVLIYSWDECDEGGGALVSKSYLATQHQIH